MAMMEETSKYERDRDAARKRAARSKAAEIVIPPCIDPKRREECLADPEKFLKTYFAERFKLPFSKNHREIIKIINDRAENGGDQAVAAPRGEGKTEITTAMIIYLILARKVRYPVIVAATGVLSQRIYSDIKSQFERNEILLEDFPEVCAPVVALEGAPQRAARQHVGGVFTRIEWKKEHCYFPFVPGSYYGGVCLSYASLDSAIRGLKIYGQRPDFVLIDDPETKESAVSDLQIAIRTQLIDRDINGLAGPDKAITRVMLCTIQNTKCLSAKYTDTEINPNWNGKRYAWIERWPDDQEFWQDYIEQRREDQRNGDQYGQTATQMYLDNRERADAGAIVSNEYRFYKNKLPNGMQVEYSALQAAYNQIAKGHDGLAAFMAEYQNDPSEINNIQTSGLTEEIVLQKISGFEQGKIPDHTEKLTMFIDVGKYELHWGMVAWHGNAIGQIVDIGIVKIPGVKHGSSEQAIELAQLEALHRSREDLLKSCKPDLVMIDSGDYTPAVYEFVRQAGGIPFVASKGWGGDNHFRLPKQSEKNILGDQWYISLQERERIWLYNFNTDHFKEWVHDRFLTRTFDENHKIQDGTLSIFTIGKNRKLHEEFASHICAEELQDIFKEGRGLVRKWVTVRKKNHFLDVIVGNCVAARILGINLIQKTELPKNSMAVASRENRDVGTGFQNQHGQRFLLTER